MIVLLSLMLVLIVVIGLSIKFWRRIDIEHEIDAEIYHTLCSYCKTSSEECDMKDECEDYKTLKMVVEKERWRDRNDK